MEGSEMAPQKSKTKTSASKKAASKMTASKKTASKKTASKKTTPKKPAPNPANAELRIRMYRVGFGDFFLVTVPAADGPQHILVDCGVTPGKTKEGDIGTIKDAVAHMADVTKSKLALIIVTHRHQDHIIGFSRSAEIFKDFEVGAVWMSFWETEYDPNEKKEKPLPFAFQEELTSLALNMQQHAAVAGAEDPNIDEILAMLQNATGVDQTELAAAGSAAAAGTPGKGGGTNAASLMFLKTGLKIKPEYYAKGDTPKMPKVLADAGLTAQILGPPPADKFDFLKLMDLKKGVGQFLDEGEDGSEKKFDPFGRQWHSRAAAFSKSKSAFREWDRESKKKPSAAMEAAIQAAQPDMLFTAATTLDGLLNNQSLVVLFTFNGKKLLFAGDAQGGNWEYWMFGGTPNNAPSADQIDKDSKIILANLDFYKVGHHGSTNATPISAVQAMGGDFASMCSTQQGSFGTVEKESEVPRIPLLAALSKKTTLVRSDQFAVTLPKNKVPAVEGAPNALPKPARGRFEEGPIFIDYFL
jgi:beta-lactamase superfamily II metal-dependent hydrolase